MCYLSICLLYFVSGWVTVYEHYEHMLRNMLSIVLSKLKGNRIIFHCITRLRGFSVTYLAFRTVSNLLIKPKSNGMECYLHFSKIPYPPLPSPKKPPPPLPSKEMLISYADFGNIGNEVDHVKVSGITLPNDLTWKRHVDNIVKGAGKIIYMLHQLKRAGVNQADHGN